MIFFTCFLLLTVESIDLEYSCLPELSARQKKADIQFTLVISINSEKEVKVINNLHPTIKLSGLERMQTCVSIERLLKENDEISVLLNWKYGKGWHSGTVFVKNRKYSVHFSK